MWYTSTGMWYTVCGMLNGVCCLVTSVCCMWYAICCILVYGISSKSQRLLWPDKTKVRIGIIIELDIQ